MSKPARPQSAEARRLAESEARYRALVEALPMVTYVAATSVQGSFTYISPQVEALLGYPPQRWVDDGRLWLSRLHPGDRGRVLPLVVQAHRQKKGFTADYRLLDRSGRPHWVRDVSTLVFCEDGEPLCVQGTWTEITGHKRRETEEAGKGRALDSSQEQLRQFVAAASHELTAPLRRIVNLAELLALRTMKRLDPESKGMLSRIRASAARLQELVGGLVEYSQEDDGAGEPEEAELSAALDAALEHLAGRIAETGAELTRGELPRVQGSEARLARVFGVLLDNALKFHGQRRPRLGVWAERSGGEWVVSVRDNGIGVARADAERIFSLFEAVHAKGDYGAGRGLGLALARKIVGGLGGRLWVESEPGDGATFRFTVPAVLRRS